MAPRTYLFVPGDRPERFGKALATGADALVLDLEDAVTPARKPHAREAVSQWLAAAEPAVRARCVVRLNDTTGAEHRADRELVAAAPMGLTLMVPKAEDPQALAELHARCTDSPLLALVETARGIEHAVAVAAAPGVQRLVFGTLDYAVDLDLDLELPGEPLGLSHAASRLAIASRLAGLVAPVAGVTTALDDEAALRADVAWARRHGLSAKLCIHPRQVAVVHDALRPAAAELDWARRVIDAAAASTGGAVQVDGRMVDRPVLLRAHALLDRGRDREHDRG